MVSSALQDTTVSVTGQSRSYFREHSRASVREPSTEKESQAREKNIPGRWGVVGYCSAKALR